MYKPLAFVFPAKLKEGWKLCLYKNPSRNMHIYLAKSFLRFESTDFASVMIDDVGSVSLVWSSCLLSPTVVIALLFLHP